MAKIRAYNELDYKTIQTNLEAADMFDEVADARENLVAMVEQDERAILVAEIDGEVVGSIYTTPFGINVVCIWRLVVDKQHRQLGVGSLLLDAIEAQARARGIKEIWGFFDTTDEMLARYYKKRGFTYNEDHKYFGMWKPLT